jgi:hypothetical protein
MMRDRLLVVTLAVAVAALSATSPLRAQATQGPLVPKPFPGSSPARPSEPTTPPPAAPQPAPEPTLPAPGRLEPVESAVQPPAGLPVYPTAEFIDGFDAGSGQRYYLYGSDMPYEDIVAYYRSVLKNGGRELFREPPTRQFDLGRFQENAMAYPPSVVVKDYAWNGSAGYLAVSGTTEKRFRTVIQIVPAGGAQ